jgi:hypothetical protein
MTSSLTLTLDSDGNLTVQLAATEGRTRPLTLECDIESTLKRILQARALAHVTIGLDGNPTEGQVRHWERHETFADDRCPWCISEGRAKPRKSESLVRSETESPIGLDRPDPRSDLRSPSRRQRKRAKRKLLMSHSGVQVRRIARAAKVPTSAGISPTSRRRTKTLELVL